MGKLTHKETAIFLKSQLFIYYELNSEKKNDSFVSVLTHFDFGWKLSNWFAKLSLLVATNVSFASVIITAAPKEIRRFMLCWETLCVFHIDQQKVIDQGNYPNVVFHDETFGWKITFI